MTKNGNIVPVEIFSGTQGEVDLVLSLLGNADIEVYLKDGFVGTIAPYLTGASPISIVVSSEDAEKAKQVISEYLKSKK